MFNNWQRKCVALLAAIVIWFFVNHSITSTKTIPHVPIRIVNVPAGKTVQGLLPNGLLAKRATLTLSGTKDIVEQLEPGDLEVHIDASKNPDEWIIQIHKKNLVSLNPEIDLGHHITQIAHNEFVIKMHRLTTVKVPITIARPVGDPPKGYQFLDIWPQELIHEISGPEEQVQALRNKGIELTFNLSDVSKADLDALQTTQPNSHGDEVSFNVPNKWKQIAIPFLGNALEEINDSEAQKLHINFLRQELIPIQGDIPIRVYYPPKHIGIMNPDTHVLDVNDLIKKRNGVFFLSLPLYTLDVSQVFLDTVRDHLEISITVAPDGRQESLHYGVEFVNPHELENQYVASMMNSHIPNRGGQTAIDSQDREEHLRARFREYMQKFVLFTNTHQPLKLTSHLEGNLIKVVVDSKSP